MSMGSGRITEPTSIPNWLISRAIMGMPATISALASGMARWPLERERDFHWSWSPVVPSKVRQLMSSDGGAEPSIP